MKKKSTKKSQINPASTELQTVDPLPAISATAPTEIVLADPAALDSPVSPAVPVTATPVQPLSADEKRKFRIAEKTIGRSLCSFYELGAALTEVRDSKLYRVQYRTFEEYLTRRWDMGRSLGYRLIDAATLKANLSSFEDTLPFNEAQARPLLSLPREQQIAVWTEVVKQRDSEPKSRLTAAKISQVVANLMKPLSARVESIGRAESTPRTVSVAMLKPVTNFLTGDLSAACTSLEPKSAALLILNTALVPAETVLPKCFSAMRPGFRAAVICDFKSEPEIRDVLDSYGCRLVDRAIYYDDIDDAGHSSPIARHLSVLLINDVKITKKTLTGVRLPDPIVASRDPDFPDALPVGLMQQLIEALTDEGDTVLIPTDRYAAGVIAAQRCNRNVLGIDRDETFYNQGRLRLDGLTEPSVTDDQDGDAEEK